MNDWPWNMWDVTPKSPDAPHCKHEPWPMWDRRFYCVQCGEVGVSSTTKPTMSTEPYVLARPVPIDYDAKVRYFAGCIERLAGHENIKTTDYHRLKGLVEVHREAVRGLTTRHSIKRYLRKTPDGGIACAHLTLFIRLCGANGYLQFPDGVRPIVSEFTALLRKNNDTKTSSFLRRFTEEVIAWPSEPEPHCAQAASVSQPRGAPSLCPGSQPASDEEMR